MGQRDKEYCECGARRRAGGRDGYRGRLLAWMGEIEFRNAEEEGFLEESARFLEYEKGLRESLRRWLGAVAREFQSTSAAMVITDEETERLFFWKATTGEAAQMEADSCPLARANEFLMDDGPPVPAGTDYTDKVTGFGWRNDDLEIAQDSSAGKIRAGIGRAFHHDRPGGFREPHVWPGVRD